MNPYQATRLRHQAEAQERLPEHFARLSWSAAQLRVHRNERLQQLLRHARECSPWHRDRFAQLDLNGFEESQLGAIPPMTKDDLMAHFDEIVSDRRLTLSRVEDHLASLSSDAYLLDGHHSVASGGSSGRRGVYVYDWAGWIDWYLTVMRRVFLQLRGHGDTPLRAVILMGERASHVSSASPQTFRELGPLIWHRLSISAPFAEQRAQLEKLQPTLLAAYPSVLRQLLRAAEAGELAIAPRLVLCSSEPLLPSVRAAVERVWGCPVLNCWASSEAGGMAVGCGQGPGLHLADDLLILEPVDRAGRAVAPGVRSSKVYVTNLFNHALPLIRFEITDEVTLLEQMCPCGSSHRLVADVEGRLDDTFEYAGAVAIHPQLFRSRLGKERGVVEYQLRQLPHGVDVSVQLQGSVDLELLRADLIALLERAGLPGALVQVRCEETFERTALGKLKRFIPLES